MWPRHEFLDADGAICWSWKYILKIVVKYRKRWWSSQNNWITGVSQVLSTKRSDMTVKGFMILIMWMLFFIIPTLICHETKEMHKCGQGEEVTGQQCNSELKESEDETHHDGSDVPTKFVIAVGSNNFQTQTHTHTMMLMNDMETNTFSKGDTRNFTQEKMSYLWTQKNASCLINGGKKLQHLLGLRGTAETWNQSSDSHYLIAGQSFNHVIDITRPQMCQKTLHQISSTSTCHIFLNSSGTLVLLTSPNCFKSCLNQLTSTQSAVSESWMFFCFVFLYTQYGSRAQTSLYDSF